MAGLINNLNENMQALETDDINFLENNSVKHKDLLISMFKFRHVKENKDGSHYYKCRSKCKETRAECKASIT